MPQTAKYFPASENVKNFLSISHSKAKPKPRGPVQTCAEDLVVRGISPPDQHFGDLSNLFVNAALDTQKSSGGSSGCRYSLHKPPDICHPGCYLLPTGQSSSRLIAFIQSSNSGQPPE